MPGGLFHCGEHIADELVGNARMEQVGHGINEDSTGPFPAKRELEARLPKAQVEALLVMMAGYAAEALSEGQGVAVIAPRRDLRAPSNRIPGSVCPLDGRSASHRGICRTFVRLCQPPTSWRFAVPAT